MDLDEFNVLLSHVRPSNSYLGKKLVDITEWRYCDVMDVVSDGTMMGMVTKATGLDEDDIMQGDASEFVAFVKHMKIEAERITELEARLGSDPSDDMVNAGIGQLNAFGVMTVYYAISPDPRDWDAISELPYHKIWTRMMIDKVNADIQNSLEKIHRQRQKTKQ